MNLTGKCHKSSEPSLCISRKCQSGPAHAGPPSNNPDSPTKSSLPVFFLKIIYSVSNTLFSLFETKLFQYNDFLCRWYRKKCTHKSAKCQCKLFSLLKLDTMKLETWLNFQDGQKGRNSNLPPTLRFCEFAAETRAKIPGVFNSTILQMPRVVTQKLSLSLLGKDLHNVASTKCNVMQLNMNYIVM